MTEQEAIRLIKKMHDEELVTNQSIIAWYTYYAQQLPKRRPEKSLNELIRTVALWMELTDKGASPGFPFNYKSGLSIQINDLTSPPRGGYFYLFGMLALGTGLVTIFFNLGLGILAMFAGIVILFAGHRKAGGAHNPDLMTEESPYLDNWSRRAIEWSESSREN